MGLSILDKIELPYDVKMESLQKVYQAAELIYRINFKKVPPEGRTFSRSLDDDAEFSYQAAARAYLHRVDNGLPKQCA